MTVRAPWMSMTRRLRLPFFRNAFGAGPRIRGFGGTRPQGYESAGGVTRQEIGVCPRVPAGLYHASKWGLEGFSQSLAQEVADFGIKVTLIEPGGFSTDWGGPSAVRAKQMPEYDGARAAMAAVRSASWAAPGDPAATGPVILKIVDAPEPPLRLFLGPSGLPVTRAEYARRIETWEKWNDLSIEAQGTTSSDAIRR